MKRQPSDLSARQQALKPQQSFIVQAPAGSGKTELLTLRILTLLSVCEKPEEILAITFTRKAAAEMRHRVLDALRFAKTNETPSAEHEKLRWQLAKNALKNDELKQWGVLDNPNRLHIKTIDGFCRHLAGKQPIISRLGTLPDTLNDAASTDHLIKNAIQTVIVSPQKDSLNALNNLLTHLDNNIDALENLFLQLMYKRDQWLFYLTDLDNGEFIQQANRQLIAELLSFLSPHLKPHAGKILTYYNHAVENMPGDQADSFSRIDNFPQAQANHVEDWKSIIWFLTTNTGIRSPKGLNKNIGILPNSPLKKEIQEFFEELNQQEELADILMQSKMIPNHPISTEKILFFKDLKILLRECVAQLNLCFKQEGVIDYTGMALAALDALGNDELVTDLSLKLDYQLKHILIDEFQDTSHLQLRLLERLISGWQADDGHSLFLVGDPMQSCYQFRNADVRIFTQIVENGIGSLSVTPLRLQENFRSHESVVHWNNNTFKDAFPKKPQKNYCAVSYAPSVSFDQANTEKSVHCYQIEYEEKSSRPHNQEAQSVVDLIKSIQNNNSNESIAVLVRNRSHAKNLFPALKNSGIPYQASDMASLSQNMLIIDLMTLTKAFLYPADSLAWLALLRSPVMGFNLQDLHALTHFNNPDETDKPFIKKITDSALCNLLSESGKNIIARCAPVIINAWKQRHRKPLRQWLEGLWISLGGPAAANPEQLEASFIFFNALEQHQKNGVINNWPLFQKSIEKLYDQSGIAEKQAIQIMTMHKAKGLEFDHVIILGLDRPPKADNKELLLWNEYFLKDGNYLLLLAALEETGSDADLHYQFLRSLQTKKLSNEAVRLLYVACTRAIKTLHLFAALTQDKDGLIKTPDSRSLLSTIWDTFQNTPQRIPSSAIQAEETMANGLRHIRRLHPNWQAPALPIDDTLSAWRGNEFEDETNVPELTSAVNLLARLEGIALHKILQLLAENKISAGAIKKDGNILHHYLSNAGISPQKITLSLKPIQETIEKISQSKIGQWILDSRHPDSLTEYELFYNNQVFIIDRSFIHEGIRWIIDYKNSTPSHLESQEDFLAKECLNYQKQLHQYAELMYKIDGGKFPIKTALYFPQLDIFEEVALSGALA